MNNINVKELVTHTERMEMPTKEIGSLKILVVDVDKVVSMIREDRKKKGLGMTILIQPIKEERFKDPFTSLTYSKDPVTGIHYGIVNKVYEDGNIKWTRININEDMNLNLERDTDAKFWAVLRMHHDVQGSPLNIEGKYEPKLKIYDPEIQAAIDNNKVMEAYKAIEIANKFKGSNLVRFSRLIDIPVSILSTPSVLHAQVLKFAYENPNEFNRIWNDTNRDYRETFKNAISVDVIRFDHSKGYYFGGFSLGVNEYLAVQFLRENPDVYVSIGQRLKSSDIVSKEFEKESINEKPQKLVETIE